MHYPNIYVLLVSHPGVGKSTAMDRGIDLLEDLREFVNPNFNIIPNQVTEAALLDLMKIKQDFQLREKTLQHSSGFFYASEASAPALQNLYGDFNSTITALYDCPRFFRKKLKGEAQTQEIENACFNLLAGSTFNYLKNLVNETSVEGGLASRFIYVIAKERKIRQARWRAYESEPSKESRELRTKLLEDLAAIHALRGPVIPDKGFIAQWEKAQPEFDKYLIGLDSNRLESLNARRFTNLMKVCILLSVSEGDSLRLTEEHWHQGRELIDNVSRENSYVVTSALVADKQSQGGLTQLLLTSIGDAAGDAVEKKIVLQKFLRHGGDTARFGDTLKFLSEAGHVEISADGGGTRLKLLINPETNL
jgi:hypothetical protein